jgi:hypothetical protein
MLPSGLPDVLDDQEDLARFLMSSSHFNATMVKAAAFLPRGGEPSVFRHGSEPNDELWQLASDHVPGNRTLHGAAIVRAQHVRAAGLDVAASEPPPRHANIVGWASLDSDPELGKAQQKEQALRIAQHAELVRR